MLPVVLDLRGALCVVVGGGRVAARKAAVLLRSGARVRVVAPRATEGLRRLARNGAVRWIRSTYRPAHLRGARIVLAATSDPAVNREAGRAARRRGLFVNVADDPKACTLTLPAVLRRGDLLIAVSTGGRSPGLARLLRDRLRAALGPEVAGWIRLAGRIRRDLQRRVADPRERARRYRRALRAAILGRPGSMPRLRAARLARGAAGFGEKGKGRHGRAS